MKKDKVSVFIDDERFPLDIKNLMGEFFVENWIIIRNYTDFVKVIDENIENINIVSFDHDIACFVGDKEFTGKDCADYLINKCIEKNIKFPNWFVHTQNIIGRQNVISSILTYLKYFEDTVPNFLYHSSGIINNNIL